MSSVRFANYCNSSIQKINEANSVGDSLSIGDNRLRLANTSTSTRTISRYPSGEGHSFAKNFYTKEMTSTETIDLRVEYLMRPKHCIIFSGSELSEKLLKDVKSNISQTVFKDHKGVVPVEILGPMVSVVNQPARSNGRLDPFAEGYSNPTPGESAELINLNTTHSTSCDYILWYMDEPDAKDAVKEAAVLLAVRDVLVRGYGWRLGEVLKSSVTVEELRMLECKLSTTSNDLAASVNFSASRQQITRLEDTINGSITLKLLDHITERESIIFASPIERTTMLFSKTIEVTRLVDITDDVISQEDKRIFSIKHSRMLYNRVMMLGTYGVLCLLGDISVPEVRGQLLKAVVRKEVMTLPKIHPLAPQCHQYPVIDLSSLLTPSCSPPSATAVISEAGDVLLNKKVLQEYIRFIEYCRSVHHNREGKIRQWRQAIEDNVIPAYFVDFTGRTLLHWVVDWSDSLFVTYDLNLASAVEALSSSILPTPVNDSILVEERSRLVGLTTCGIVPTPGVLPEPCLKLKGLPPNSFGQLKDIILFCIEVGLSPMLCDSCGDSAVDIARAKATRWEQLSDVAAAQQSVLYAKDQIELSHFLSCSISGLMGKYISRHYNIRAVLPFTAALQIFLGKERHQRIHPTAPIGFHGDHAVCHLPMTPSPIADIRGPEISMASSKLISVLRGEQRRNKQIPSLGSPVYESSRNDAVLYASFSATNPNILFTLKMIPNDWRDGGGPVGSYEESMKRGAGERIPHGRVQGSPHKQDCGGDKISSQYAVFLYDIYLERTILVYRFPPNDIGRTFKEDAKYQPQHLHAFYVLPFCVSTHGTTTTDILLMSNGAWVGIDYTHKYPTFTVVNQSRLLESRIFPPFSVRNARGHHGINGDPNRDVTVISFNERGVAAGGQMMDVNLSREIYIKECVYKSFDCSKLFTETEGDHCETKVCQTKDSIQEQPQEGAIYRDGLNFKILWLDRKKSDVHYVRHKAGEMSRRRIEEEKRKEESIMIMGSSVASNKLPLPSTLEGHTEPFPRALTKMHHHQSKITSLPLKIVNNHTQPKWRGRDAEINDITKTHEMFAHKLMLYPYYESKSGKIDHLATVLQNNIRLEQQFAVGSTSEGNTGDGVSLLEGALLTDTSTVQHHSLPMQGNEMGPARDSLTVGVACFQKGSYLYCLHFTDSDMHSVDLPYPHPKDINNSQEIERGSTTLESRMQRIVNKITECCTYQDVQKYINDSRFHSTNIMPRRSSLSFSSLPRVQKSKDEPNHHPDLSVFRIPNSSTSSGNENTVDGIPTSRERLVITTGGSSVYAAGLNGLLIEYNAYTREFTTMTISADGIDSAGTPMCLEAVSEPVYGVHTTCDIRGSTNKVRYKEDTGVSMCDYSLLGSITDSYARHDTSDHTSGAWEIRDHSPLADAYQGQMSVSEEQYYDSGCFWTPNHPFPWLVDPIFMDLISSRRMLSHHQPNDVFRSLLSHSYTSLVITRRQVQLQKGAPDKVLLKHLTPDIDKRSTSGNFPQGIKMIPCQASQSSTGPRAFDNNNITTSNTVTGPVRPTRIIWAGKNIYIRTLNSHLSRELLQEYNIPGGETEGSSFVAISPADPDGIYITRAGIMYRVDLYKRAVYTLYSIPSSCNEKEPVSNNETIDSGLTSSTEIPTCTDNIIFNIDGTMMLRYSAVYRSVSVYNAREVIYTRAAHECQTLVISDNIMCELGRADRVC